MEKPFDQQDNDITQEPYKGPGALVTGAGEGAIAHYGTMFAGLFGGGTLSGIFYKQVDHVEQAFRNFSKNNAAHENVVKRWSANIAGWVQNTADKIAHHMPQKLLQRVPQERVRAVIFGGGILGFLGFFVAPLYFMFTGAKHSNEGRQQFERAKDEILTTRAERDALLQKYADVKTELDTMKATAPGSTLKVAADAPPAIDTRADSTAALSRAEQGDSPVSISKPKIEGPPIQAPTIQRPTIEGPGPESPIPRNQWWDGKEHGASHAERLATRDADAAQHETAR